MKRYALSLAVLIAAIVFGQPQTGGFGTGGNSGRTGPAFSQPLAFFEFAPASGAGMGTSCACSAVTGAKGEAVTFARTGSAICSRQGLATTGIANGDLVSCGANLPRVESSGGVLGLRVESSRINQVLRSEEFDNAAWSSSSSGVVVPTITANAATAPDGTLTADRIQVPATASTQLSYVFQGGLATTQAVTTVYVRGNGSSGSINVLSGATPNACVSCAYVSGSWTRCELLSAVGAGNFIFIGNDSNSAVCGTGAKGAIDAFIWGAQHEVGTYPTSYIPTVASAVTRNAETATSGVSLAGLASSGCARATAARPTAATNGTAVYLGDTTGRAIYFASASHLAFDGTNNPTRATTFSTVGKWYITRWAGSSFTLENQDTGPAVTAFDGTMGIGTLTLGDSAPNLPLDGILTRVQLDPDSTRCTP